MPAHARIERGTRRVQVRAGGAWRRFGNGSGARSASAARDPRIPQASTKLTF